MLKRFSSTLRRDKKKDQNNTSTSNGTSNRTNGYQSTSSSAPAKATTNGTGPAVNGNGVVAPRRKSTFGFNKHSSGSGNESEDHDVERKDIDEMFQEFAQIIHASKRPLPNQNGDGTYNEHKEFTGLKDDMKALGWKDYKTLLEVIKGRLSGDLVDDRTMVMERLIQAVAGLPPLSKNRVELTNGFIGELWDTLEHPPLSYMGDDFIYRKADGSNNNIMYPHLGAAGTPYARSCRPATVMPGALPDPGVIYDCVMKRYEYKPHPNGVSSMLWYIASIIIHDLFRTDRNDFNKSLTSSYLDLSPLYGSNQDEQNTIRTFKDGKLKPDCFAEKRLLGFPPGVGILLIMFNRFHNYVADQLAIINEGGKFTKPTHGLTAEGMEKSWEKYDHDLFQTARLITSGLYINIILTDYVRTIIGLNRTNSTWTLDPRAEMGKDAGVAEGVERGTGNQVSAEFNLFYRWHSCISDRDDKWTQSLYKKLWPGKDPSEVTLQEMMIGLGKWERTIPEDPIQRPFGNFTRGADGRLDDDELVQCLTESIEDLAGAFGANNVPQCMKPIEILGIIQGRKWNVAGLNEFRKHFGLKPHDTFEEINPDPKVANHLRHLYEHPDFVELYPGIVAEDAKAPMTPGVGICPTYTISRVILSDAVCLVRGDRFYTVDYHPRNLTNWGFTEVSTDLAINQGCVFYKLITRAFPSHFKGDSAYAHYPMTIPSATKEIMTDLKRVHMYSFDRPARTKPRVNLVSYQGAKYVLQNQQKYKVTWGEGFQKVFGNGGSNFMLSGDGSLYAKQRQLMGKSLYKEKWKVHLKEFYEYITQRLIVENSYDLAGVQQVDIVRDVGNITHVHFAADVFSLPLKTAEHPHGLFTEHELYMILAAVFIAIFFDLDTTKSFALQQAAHAAANKLGAIVEANVKFASKTGFMSGVTDKMAEGKGPLKEYGIHMIRQLLAAGLTPYEVTWSQMLPTAGAMVANQAQVFAQALDYYLGEGKAHLPEINRVAKLNTPEGDDILLHYAMEGIRLAGTFGLYREATEADVINDGESGNVSVKAGDSVFVSFVGAARDTVVFPSPNDVRLDRPLDAYIHYGVGEHTCLGKDASMTAITAMFKVVGRLDNLRRAPGAQGELKKIPRPGGFFIYMREDRGSYFPFPTTMKINWDGAVGKTNGLNAVNGVNGVKR